MKYGLFLIAGISLLAYSCSKDDNNVPDPEPPPEPTAVEKITSATWKIDTLGIDSDNNGTIDIALPVNLQDCDKDNTLTFAADSTAVYSEGVTKCDPDNLDSTPLEWYLKDDAKIINITGDIANLQGDVDVITLTDTDLILSNEIALPARYPAGTKLIVALKK